MARHRVRLAEGAPRTIASYGTLNRRFGGEWDSILTWAGLEPLGGRTTGRRNPNPPKGPRVTSGRWRPTAPTHFG